MKTLACTEIQISRPSEILVSSEYATALNGELPAEVMYFPAGKHTLSPSVNGQAKQISVTVSPSTADVLQAELDSLLAENVRPFIDFDHRDGAAAALPKRFVWKDEGVMLELDWTGAGKNAVTGRDYSYFSPTFLLNENGSPAGLPKSGAIGALTNNPAFRQIKRIAAKQDAECSINKQGNNMADEEVTALRQEIESVKAENQTLKAAAEVQKIEAANSATTKELDALKKENETLKAQFEAQRIEAVNREAELLIEAAVNAGKIEPKNEKYKASLKKWLLIDNSTAKEHIDSLPVNAAFKQVVNVTAGHRDVGKAPSPKVADTNTQQSDNGRVCKSIVREYQETHPGTTFERAWAMCAEKQPEVFYAANS